MDNQAKLSCPWHGSLFTTTERLVMFSHLFRLPLRLFFSFLILCNAYQTLALAQSPTANTTVNKAVVSLRTLSSSLKVGDVVFIQVKAKPFQEVAAATASWTNHVGIVVDTSENEVLIAESTFPFSRITTLSRFVARSEQGRLAVSRLATPLTEKQMQAIAKAAQSRLGILYDTGFNLHSSRQFCSRYVREVLQEATGLTVGEVETFGSLLERHPQADLSFWQVWYFGHIPWQRQTVTPASVLRSPALISIFDAWVAE